EPGVGTWDDECSIIMLVRTLPRVEFNYNLLSAALSPHPPKAPESALGTSAIVRYGAMKVEDAARCRYVLATNGFMPTHYFDGNAYVQGAYFGEAVSYENISDRMTQEKLRRALLADDISHNIVCIDSESSAKELLAIAAFNSAVIATKLTIVYYGTMTPTVRQILGTLSTLAIVMTIPHLARDVCALTQQLCHAVKRLCANLRN